MMWLFFQLFNWISLISESDMYRLSFLLLSICTVGFGRDVKISKRALESFGRRCLPGESWKQECNFCLCSNQGFAFCTRRLCHVPLNQIDDNDELCKPGSRWKMGCEVCFCSVDGTPICDESLCVKRQNPEKNDRTKRETEKYCQPNYHWDDGCNTFGCLPNGLSYSTEKLCPEKDYKKNVPMCEKDAKFRINNKYCFCNDQREVVCNKLRRIEVPAREISPNGFCQPNYTWTDGCNQYRCSQRGTPFSTRQLCGLEDYIDKFAICEEGAKFDIKGLKCYCEAGVGICKNETRTKRSLLDEMGKTIFCQPGFKWNDGCNTQGCGDNGIMYTTAKACPESEINQNVRICEKGATWTFENRACHCNDKGQGVCASKLSYSAVVKLG